MPVLDLESMDVLITETYKMDGNVTLKCPDLNTVTRLRVYNHSSGSVRYSGALSMLTHIKQV